MIKSLDDSGEHIFAALTTDFWPSDYQEHAPGRQGPMVWLRYNHLLSGSILSWVPLSLSHSPEEWDRWVKIQSCEILSSHSSYMAQTHEILGSSLDLDCCLLLLSHCSPPWLRKDLLLSLFESLKWKHKVMANSCYMHRLSESQRRLLRPNSQSKIYSATHEMSRS